MSPRHETSTVMSPHGASVKEKLSSKNYHTWKKSMRGPLCEKGVFKIVTGTEAKPVAPIKPPKPTYYEQVGATPLSSEQVAVNETKKEDNLLLRKERKGRKSIRNHLQKLQRLNPTGYYCCRLISRCLANPQVQIRENKPPRRS